MTDPTPRQLAEELLRLDGRATPGPWATGTADAHRRREVRVNGTTDCAAFCGGPDGQAQRDAAFIAFARNAARALAERVIALESERDALHEAIDGANVMFPDRACNGAPTISAGDWSRIVSLTKRGTP